MFNKPALLHSNKTGKGQQVSRIPWISSDFADLGVVPVLPPKSLQLSQSWFDEYGNVFIVRFAAAAFAIGQTASWQAPAASTVGAAAPAPSVRAINWVAGGLTAGAEKGNFLYETQFGISGLTDALKEIKDNTATSITISLVDTKVSNLQNDADAWAAAPTAGDNVTIIRPYNAVPFPTANAAFDAVIGVALGAVVINHYGFFQVGGLALVASIGNGTALAANKPVVPSAANAGVAIGSAAAAANQFGLATAAYSNAAQGLVPVWLTILDQ